MNKIYEHENNIKRLSKELEDEQQFFIKRIAYLRKVALSVLNKSFGNDKTQITKFVNNNKGYGWLITSFTNDNLNIHSFLRNTGISISILSLSDRDFAKILRKAIKKHKENEEQKKLNDLKVTMAQNKKKIAELQEELNTAEIQAQKIIQRQNKRADQIEERLIKNIHEKRK